MNRIKTKYKNKHYVPKKTQILGHFATHKLLMKSIKLDSIVLQDRQLVKQFA